MVVLGIDQTGAVSANGVPKPLPACLIENDQISLLYLKKFDQEIASYKPKAICIDCVLGIPQNLPLTWRQAIAKTKIYEGYGRKVSEKYFSDLGSGLIHKRQIEQKINANSMFQTHPFQKNIQTGTFRFWKEMAIDPDWFYVPSLTFEKTSSEKIPVVEGYPSLSWKQIFHVNTRKPLDVLNLLKKYYPTFKISATEKTLISKDPNLADALVLALGLREKISELKKIKKSKEGWILGT